MISEPTGGDGAGAAEGRGGPNGGLTILPLPGPQMTWQPPTRLFGQTGLGHWPSRGGTGLISVPPGQATIGGWYREQN